MSTAIAVFVKTPGLSPLKTRLAVGIGNPAALAFYLLSVKAVQETIKNSPINPYWAVAEAHGLGDPLWQDFQTLHTGEGNLGQRQHHIYATLLQNHAKVLLIGADAPQISASLLQQAIAALDTSDFVVGPAHDGGYYLFGGRKPTAQSIWTSVPWSTSETRDKLEAALPSKPVHLKSLTDVDTKADLSSVEAEMPQVLNKAQKQLIDWINQLQEAESVS